MLHKFNILRKNTKIVKKYFRAKNEVYNNRWLFSSTDNVCFNYNSKYLFEYVLNNYKDIVPYYVINDEKYRWKLNKKYGIKNFINTSTRSGIYKALSCKVWFTSAGLPVYAPNLYEHYDIVNLWHGIPLKKIALDDKNLSSLNRLYFRKIFSENYKYILTSSPHLIPIMCRSFDVKADKIKIWGQPRCDALYDENDRNLILDELLKERANKPQRLILYAPTFRDNKETKLFPFYDYDKNKLDNYLRDSGSVIFVKKHIKEKADFSKYLSDYVIEFNVDADIMSYLNIFDCLITDYSSIYIDYLKLNRSIIFLDYDKAQYLKDRGFNFDFDSITPGAKPRNLQNFIYALSGKDEYIYKEKRKIVAEIIDTTNGRVSDNICQNMMKEVGLI